jgi:hypothetical protein
MAPKRKLARHNEERSVLHFSEDLFTVDLESYKHTIENGIYVFTSDQSNIFSRVRSSKLNADRMSSINL